MWYQNGEVHRDNDKPAVVCEEFQRGKLRRDNDKPAYIESNGNQIWYQHGELHRDGSKPAAIWYEMQTWYQHGEQISAINRQLLHAMYHACIAPIAHTICILIVFVIL